GAGFPFHRLDRAGGRGGEALRALGEPRDLGGMPLQAGEPLRYSVEHYARGALLGQAHVHEADLGRFGRPDRAAERLGKELVAEAETEERHSALRDRLPDERLLGGEPGVDVLLPDVHRAAEGPEGVITVDSGQGVAFVEMDGVVFMAVLGEEFPENTRILDPLVLKDKDAHGSSFHRSAPRARWRHTIPG